MPIPIDPEDFSAIGARFQSEDIVSEIDRLVPLATTDLPHLTTRGYGPARLAQLKAYRDNLVAEVAARKQQRGSKKGARKTEAVALQEGKLILRSGVTIAESAIEGRVPPPNETPEQTRKLVTEIVEQIDALGGRIGSDSAKLRTRLTSLVSILALPALAPSVDDAPSRAEFVAKIQSTIGALPSLAEQKKALQQDAKQATATLDEIDGRAYQNLKMLTKAGRAYWNEHKNRKRAAEYHLNNLHEAATKPAGDEPAPPVAPVEKAPPKDK
jgi:hypothetical protein